MPQRYRTATLTSTAWIFRLLPCRLAKVAAVSSSPIAAAHSQLEAADAMLIVGSSLMVYSGYHFAVAAARRGIPIAAVNIGRTRADDLLALKIEERCETALSFLL